jgi:hypothetical protein
MSIETGETVPEKGATTTGDRSRWLTAKVAVADAEAGGPHSSGIPALRSPSIMWAWSSGRSPGWRSRTNLSNRAGAIALAFSSASFASVVRPIWPSAAASTR